MRHDGRETRHEFSRIFGGVPLPIPYNDRKIAVARILS